jgi:hypothetical protein
MPGSRVNADAVRNVSALDTLLARTFGAQPRQYEYSPDSGLNVAQSIGPRLVLGGADDLEAKIAAVQTVVRHLEASHTVAQMIDVRFGDRPYYR